MKNHFATRLKYLRVKNKYKLRELATELNISPSALSRWELNKVYPKADDLITLASFFNVSVDYLLGISKTELPTLSFTQNEIFRFIVEPLTNSEKVIKTIFLLCMIPEKDINIISTMAKFILEKNGIEATDGLLYDKYSKLFSKGANNE